MNPKLLKKLEPFKINYRNNKLIIENLSLMNNLSEYKVVYEISKLSKVIETGNLSLALPPEKTKEYSLYFKSILNENVPYFLNIYIMEVDHIVAFNQFILKEENKLTYHKDLEFDKIKDLKIENSYVTLDSFKLQDLKEAESYKVVTTPKSIDISADLIDYNLLKYHMESKDNRLCIRYTFNTYNINVKKLGMKISFNSDIYKKVLYFGEGPYNSDRFLKIGLDSLYSFNISNEPINRSNVRIVSILNEDNHGLRIEYADCIFNIQLIDNELYILLRDEYSKDLIKDNSEYSFELIFDLV